MISVVTISWNAALEIAGTLQSVLSQRSDSFEAIVVDGASTDDTVNVAFKVLEQSGFPEDRCQIVSERDGGIYDAMNKGVHLARGEYVLFMNCGDRFYDADVIPAFERLIAAMDKDAYYGDTLMEYYEGKGILRDGENSPRNPVMPFIHQSVIVRRSLLLKHPFDLSYKIVADFEFFLWMRRQGCTFHHESFVVSVYDAKEGMSENNPLRIRLEKDRAMGRDCTKYYWLRKLKLRVTVGLIQTIKDTVPRKWLNFYFRRKRRYIEWVD